MITTLKTAREKRLAWATMLLIIGVVLHVTVVGPQLRQRKSRLDHLHRLQLTLAKMKADLLIRDRIEKSYARIESTIASKGSEQRNISSFTRELSVLYSNLNVKIRSIKLLPTTREQFYTRLSMNIEMTGHINEIIRFIIAVETKANPFKIEKLDLTAQEIADNIQASLVISQIVADPESKV